MALTWQKKLFLCNLFMCIMTFKFEYLRDFEFVFINNSGSEWGDQMDVFDEVQNHVPVYLWVEKEILSWNPMERREFLSWLCCVERTQNIGTLQLGEYGFCLEQPPSPPPRNKINSPTPTHSLLRITYSHWTLANYVPSGLCTLLQLKHSHNWKPQYVNTVNVYICIR